MMATVLGFVICSWEISIYSYADNFQTDLVNGGWGISYEIALRWMPLDLTDKSKRDVNLLTHTHTFVTNLFETTIEIQTTSWNKMHFICRPNFVILFKVYY